jgi:hypothetical protein
MHGNNAETDAFRRHLIQVNRIPSPNHSCNGAINFAKKHRRNTAATNKLQVGRFEVRSSIFCYSSCFSSARGDAASFIFHYYLGLALKAKTVISITKNGDVGHLPGILLRG